MDLEHDSWSLTVQYGSPSGGGDTETYNGFGLIRCTLLDTWNYSKCSSIVLTFLSNEIKLARKNNRKIMHAGANSSFSNVCEVGNRAHDWTAVCTVDSVYRELSALLRALLSNWDLACIVTVSRNTILTFWPLSIVGRLRVTYPTTWPV
jgi:hypothetical protein